MTNIKRQVLTGTIWSFLGQLSYLIIGFIANLVLARLLTPVEFGQLGIVMFFILISKVLTESGMSGALIRKQDATDQDFSTVFVFNLVISVTLFLLLFGFSGFIADAYSDPQLKSILRVLSFILIINAFQFTQNAKVVKDLRFKDQSKYTVISIIISSSLGILLAFFNFGVWALVYMQLANALILTSLYWIFEGPIKEFVFKKESFKSLYKFGVNTTLASILNTIFDNVYSLILGRYFAIQQTGFYYQAKKLQEIPIGLIQSSTLGVVFSTLSKLQNDKEKFDNFYDKIVKIFTVIVGLLCLVIYFFSEQAILLLYGDKWIDSVFFLKALIVAAFFTMQEMLNRVLFKVFDRTDKILHLEIIKKSIQAISIIVGLFSKDIKVLIYGFVVTSFISYFINYYYSRKVYSSFSWKEIKYVLSVAITAILTVQIFQAVTKLLNIVGYQVLVLLPFVVTVYFLFCKVFKIIDVINEIKGLKNFVK